MKIEILGTGCTRCEQLYANAVAAAESFGPDAGIGVEKNGDIWHFTRLGVFMTMGLVIDGVVVAAGKVLTSGDIQTKIRERR